MQMDQIVSLFCSDLSSCCTHFLRSNFIAKIIVAFILADLSKKMLGYEIDPAIKSEEGVICKTY